MSFLKAKKLGYLGAASALLARISGHRGRLELRLPQEPSNSVLEQSFWSGALGTRRTDVLYVWAHIFLLL